MKIALLIFVSLMFVQQGEGQGGIRKCTMGDKTYEKNEEFQSGSFMVKCLVNEYETRWFTEMVACLTPDGERIEPDSSVRKGPATFRCDKRSNGLLGMGVSFGFGKRNTPKKTTCTSEGKERKNGETWTSSTGTFIKKCIVTTTRWQVVITHCVLPDGTKVPVNTKKNDGTFTWDCIMKGNKAALNPIPNKKA